MNNKTKKIMRILLNVIMIISMLNSVVLATTSTEERIENSLGKILNALAWLGYAIAFGMFIFVGAKYTLSAANEKADVKRGMVGFVIGAFLIAGASTIAALFVNIASSGNDDRGDLATKIIQSVSGG